jgi:hypothetical protein
MYYLAVATSACAGLKCNRRVGQATLANLDECVYWSVVDRSRSYPGWPHSSQVIIFFATAAVLILSLLLPERFRR